MSKWIITAQDMLLEWVAILRSCDRFHPSDDGREFCYALNERDFERRYGP
jgi:hypothetical protein